MIRDDSRRAAVKGLALQGLTLAQISRELDIAFGSAQYFTRSLMLAGEVPAAMARKDGAAALTSMQHVELLRRREGLRAGTMSQLLRHLSMEHVNWLIRQVPKGGTVADVIRACVVDAFEGEQ
jgi:orotate phosphoribosyltransferase-like protein